MAMNPTASTSVSAIRMALRSPPTEPVTTESTSIPSTSSMTAAASTILASRVEISPRSERTRAVMPTLVATSAVPMNSASALG